MSRTDRICVRGTGFAGQDVRLLAANMMLYCQQLLKRVSRFYELGMLNALVLAIPFEEGKCFSRRKESYEGYDA